MRTKRKLYGFLVLLVTAGATVSVYLLLRPKPNVEDRFVQNIRSENRTADQASVDEQIGYKEPGNSALLPNPNHTYQTFNNCGPATLSMVLSFYGVYASQEELGSKMRPYQNPQGDNDDKTIFSYEFVNWAEEYGLRSISRVNGDIETLKKFTSNGIPVVVKTWLYKDDDVGHFRLVRGFDESKQVIVQDDSYQGPNRKFSYYDFLNLWQPFNYNYIIVYRPEQEDLVNAILGEEQDEIKAWINSNQRAKKEEEVDPQNPYPVFNQSTSYYHMGEYQRSVEAFERVEYSLPNRMLWYQIEPIRSYKELGNYDRTFQIADNILENGNRAYSELYYLKGEIYLEQGKAEEAREQFLMALEYNENYQQARDKLDELN